VEFGACDCDGGHFGIRDDDAFWILVGIELAMDREAGRRRIHSTAEPSIGNPATFTDKFLLLGIDGYDRLLLDQRCLDQIIDVAKLGVSIRMAVAFSGLAIGLQAEVPALT
jgi:hypothetical protein